MGTEAVNEQDGRGRHPNSLRNLAAPFKPGQSGNPSGRPKNVLSKAIRKKLEEVEEGQSKSVAERITDKLAELALDGNIEAIKLLGDRSEGRPRQSVTVTTDARERAEGRAARLMSAAATQGETMTRVEALRLLVEEGDEEAEAILDEES